MASHIYFMMLYVDIGRPQRDRFVIDALYLIQDCNRSNMDCNRSNTVTTYLQNKFH